MAFVTPDKDRAPSPPRRPRLTRSSSKSRSPQAASATMTTLPDASSGFSPATATITAGTADATTPPIPVKKNMRVRRGVVKTTPRYISESNHEAESIQPPQSNSEPEPEPSDKVETNRTPGSTIADIVAQEEPADGSLHFDTMEPFPVVIPELSMLKAKATPSISSSPSSSPRVKQTPTHSPRAPGSKEYTPRRRRRLLDSEPEPEMEPAIDAEIEHGPATAGEESEAAVIKEIHQHIGRNLVLGDDDEEEEVEDEPLETPDWTFEKPAKEAAAVIKGPHQGASPVRSPRQDKQERPQGQRRADKEGDAVDVLKNRRTSRRLSAGKIALTRIPSPPILEESIFVDGVVTSSELSSESKTPPRSRPTIAQVQDDSIDLKESRTINRPLNKGKSLHRSPLTTKRAQEEPSVVDVVKSTNPLQSKNKAPSGSRPKTTQPQSQQPSVISEKSRPNPHAKSGTEEDMVADPQNKAVVKSPVPAKETRTYQQHFGFCEKKPYRQVDYVHAYDWMSPTAPVRVANNEVQQRIDKLRNELESSDQNQEASSLYTTKAKSARRTSHNRIIEEEILTLSNGRHPFPPTIVQCRCHWCGIRIADDCPDTIEEQFVGAQVQIKDVGILPLAYRFDHEQKRLCNDCAYECGVLLKSKRKFQLLYELSVRILPLSCVNCGIRESDRFQPDVGYMGLLCSVCSTYKKQNGLNFEIQNDQIRIEELLESIVGHTVDGAIRWDRIANDSRANPNFEHSAHGLLHRWVQHQKKPDQPNMSTYILLQHNHFTRRSPRSRLYTCHASTPTQAALYFSRFVTLYKKQPMSYIYIRKLETWNIPVSRGDEWEDQSSGLQTFDELKHRIRASVLEESPRDMTTSEIRELYDKMFPSNQEQVMKTPHTGFHEEWKSRLFELLSDLLGQENRHLVQQLHFDYEAWNQYLLEWFVPRRFFAGVLNQRIASPPSAVSEDDLERIAVDVEKVGFDDRTLDNIIEEKQGLVRSSTGLGFVPLDPPEPRFKQLPEWAQKRARKVHRQAIQDERLNRIHQRHLFYESVGKSKPKDALGFDLDTSLKDAAAILFAFCTDHGFERSLEDCMELVRKARERGGVAETEPLQVSRLRKIFVQRIVEVEEQERANGTRAPLPSAYDPTPMPSAQLPTHSVPVESQVHVYQAVLTAEARTVDVRLVRTERYKLQGDSLAGGGPIQIPKIINREALRGFYREADRAERYAPVMNKKSEEISDTTIVLRSDKGGSDSGLSGVETWKRIDLDTMIRLGVAEPFTTSALPGGGVKVWRGHAESKAKKPEVLKQRREKMCEVSRLPREDVQILDKGLYRVTREVLNADGGARTDKAMAGEREREEREEPLLAPRSYGITPDVDKRRKRQQTEDVEEMDEDVADDKGTGEGTSQVSDVGSAVSRTSTSSRPQKRPRSSRPEDPVQATGKGRGKGGKTGQRV